MKELTGNSLVNLAVADFATTPVPAGGAGSLCWSTTTAAVARWDGAHWISQYPYYSGLGSVAATAGLNTTDTILANVRAGGLFVAGSTYRITLAGTCTTTVANASTFTLRYGTARTTADATIATFAVTSAATGTSIPFRVEMLLTIRTVGATGTVAGTATVLNNGVTGIAAAAVTVVALTPSAINTTLDGYLSASYKSAALTTTSTFQNTIVESVR